MDRGQLRARENAITLCKRSRRPQVVAVLLVLGGLMASSQAQAYPRCGCTSSIGRADLDGSEANPTFVSETAGSHGIAVDAQQVYWTNPGFGVPTPMSSIGRANLDAGDVDQRFIVTVNAASGPAGVAVDGEHVYWTNPGPSTIGRANLDGTEVDQSFITTSGAYYSVDDVAVDSAHVYWTNTDAGTIGRANLDGTALDPGFLTGAAHPDDLAVDSDHIYWVNTAAVGMSDPTETIGRADLNGTNVDQSFINTISVLEPSRQGGVAVDAGHIYWTNRTASAIGRAALDGTDVDQGFITEAESPEDVAVDSGHVYWANWDWGADPPEDLSPPKTKLTKDAPNKTRKTKVRFKFGSSEPDSTFECKLDKKKWKPCASPKTLKHLGDGNHRFRVRAIDAAGNTDSTPAKDKFRVVRE